MTSVRLLIAALLLCTLPAVAQESKMLPGNLQPDSGVANQTAKASEPWIIIPNGELKATSRDPLGRIQDYLSHPRKTGQRPDSTLFIPPLVADNIAVLPDGADATCYAIRSYVVARDSKDSESTHPVGYSTCRKASRYHVKTVEAKPSDNR